MNEAESGLRPRLHTLKRHGNDNAEDFLTHLGVLVHRRITRVRVKITSTSSSTSTSKNFFGKSRCQRRNRRRATRIHSDDARSADAPPKKLASKPSGTKDLIIIETNGYVYILIYIETRTRTYVWRFFASKVSIFFAKQIGSCIGCLFTSGGFAGGSPRR